MSPPEGFSAFFTCVVKVLVFLACSLFCKAMLFAPTLELC